MLISGVEFLDLSKQEFDAFLLHGSEVARDSAGVAHSQHDPRVSWGERIHRRAVDEDDPVLFVQHSPQPVRGDDPAGSGAEDEDRLGRHGPLLEPD